MNIRMIIRLLGMVLQYEGVLMLPAMAVSLLYREACWWAILVGATVSLGVGTLLRRISPKKRQMHVREGFAAVVLIWLSASLVGALPFVICGAIPNYLDALFEVVSGFTTTGSSILTDIEALPM
ncbi:MAG TPA: potassium transporter TrkG, partial [Clostridia bacterium]|nr:potassium transporter TrkG [Clostridia bacterium]